MIPKIIDGLGLLKHHEGYSDVVYEDSLGYPTGGYGTLLSIGTRLPKAVWDMALKFAYEEAEADIDKQFCYPHVLDPVRRVVLIDMRYNLGPEPFDGDGLKDWPIFVRQVKEGKYMEAAANMRSTLWYKQVGSRGERLARMMETGEWPSV
jgi:GH24 family phage-related lysozyme (muramidase)